MKPNDKEKDYCRKGHDDDRIIRTLLKKELVNDKTQHVLDVDSDDFCRKHDIDLMLINKVYDTTTAEVKADDFPALKDGKKYIFLELVSNSKKFKESDGKDGLGCILTSKAKHFIFYFIKYDYYLVIESQKLRDYILKNKDKYEEKKATTWSPNNKEIWYHSYGRVVPVSDIVKNGGILKKSRYKYIDVKMDLGL